MTLYLLALIVGCALLYGGGELLVRGASSTGARMGLSPALIGLILVSLGTSAPELFVSAGAALQGYGDVAVGNALGSNVVNICLVLGIGALLAPLPINPDVRDRQMPFMLVLTALAIVLLADGRLTRIEGALLLVVTAVGLGVLIWKGGDSGALAAEAPEVAEAVEGPEPSLFMTVLPLLAGVVLLAFGAEGLIYGGVGLAGILGVPDAVIALTVTSIGTGLPEITATVIAASRREHEMAIGNVVGSNIMNLGLVLGGSSLLRPLNSGGIDMTTFAVLGALTLLALLIARWPGRVSRSMGAGLLVAYGLYVLAL